MSALKTQEQMESLRASFRALGYLRKSERQDWIREVRVPWGFLVVAANWGGDCWETFKASGSVYVNLIALQRIVHLSDEPQQSTLMGWQLLIGPLRLNWAYVRAN
jgi:hypothetical protein